MSSGQQEGVYTSYLVSDRKGHKHHNISVQVTTQQTSQRTNENEVQPNSKPRVESIEQASKAHLPVNLANYLPGGKIPTFEEQLQIDQRRQQLLNQRQFRMIKNLQYAKSTYKRKSASVSSVPVSRFARVRGSSQETYTASSNTKLQTPTDYQSQNNSDHNGYLHRNSLPSKVSLVRKPDFSLAYSASGQLMPRRLVQARMPSLHNFGDANGTIMSNFNSIGQSSSAIPTFGHKRHMSVDENKVHSASFQMLEQKNRNNMSLNEEVDMSLLEKTAVSSKMLINASERRMAMYNLQEKARQYVSTRITTTSAMKDESSAQEIETVSKDIEDTQNSVFPRINRQLDQKSSMHGTIQIEANKRLRFPSSMGVGGKSILRSNQKKASVDRTSDYKEQEKTVGFNKQEQITSQNKMETSYLNGYSELDISEATILNKNEKLVTEPQRQRQSQGAETQESLIEELDDQTSKDVNEQSFLGSIRAFKSAQQPKDGQEEEQEQVTMKNQKALIEGPSTKKFKVLASLMASSLEKQFSKHLVGPINENQRIRLRKEFEQVYKQKTKGIQQALKPIKFRNQTVAMGVVPTSGRSSEDGTSKKSLSSDKRDRKVSYQTSSDLSSLPDQQPSEENNSNSSSEERYDVFKQTKALINTDSGQRRTTSHSLQRKSHKPKEHKQPPILPKGMTKKTLYDDVLFDKWFQECFRNPPPTREELVMKIVRKNERKEKRRRDRQELQKLRRQSKLDDGYSTDSKADDDEDDFSDDSSKDKVNMQMQDAVTSQTNVSKRASAKTTGQELDEKLEQQRINNMYFDPKAELNLEHQDSDEELRQPDNLKKLVMQIMTPEEDFTLNLSPDVQNILDFFKVTVKGTQEKRTAKRTRLTTHFMRQYHKFFRMEMEWAYFEYGNLLQFLPQYQGDQQLFLNFFKESENQRQKIKQSRKLELSNETKDEYMARMDRKEKDLLDLMHRIGKDNLEMMQQRHEQRILSRLIDGEQEVAEQEMLEQKGEALRELLDEQGPSKKLQDFQKNLQPQNQLEEVKLEPHQKESMSPQRKFISSRFGQKLIDEMQTNQWKKEQNYENLKNRRNGLGQTGASMQLEFNYLNRSQQLLKKAKAVDSILQTPFNLSSPQPSEPQNVRKSDESVLSAAGKKRAKEAAIKEKLEVSEELEIFQESKLREQYFRSLRKKKPHENDRDAKINADYSRFCIQDQNVHDLPIFTRIKDNKLTLSGYTLNSGLCKALGIYLGESNWRIDKSFLLKELVLDNNSLSDEDFAEILAGVCIQSQLQQLSYARNSFGIESVTQLEKIIQQQEVNQVDFQLCLSQIRLVKIKTSPEVLNQLFTSCFVQMQNLTQLKLQGIPLNQVEITDALMSGLENHKDRLELLDLQDTQLTSVQLVKIASELQSYKQIHSLDFSYNSVRQVEEELVSNLCALIQMDSKLNHFAVSYMHLGFKACSSIAQAASKSQSLCALHMSGNKLFLHHQKHLLRIMGIRECEIETSAESVNRISTDEVKHALFEEQLSDLSQRTPVLSALPSERKTKRTAGSQEKRRNFKRSDQLGDKTLDQASNDPIVKQNLENLSRPSWDKPYEKSKVVNAYISKANQINRAQMHSQTDGQVYQRANLDNLVFSRQVFNPELFQNQDINKDEVQFDLQAPFKWHVNNKSDHCYICQQWRYCLLFFSRKQVIESNFFTPVQTGSARVTLDKICGFTNQKAKKYHNDQPWIIGSFTAVTKSQFVPIADFTSVLKWRLQKSRFLKVTQAVSNALNSGIAGFFGSGLKAMQNNRKLLQSSTQSVENIDTQLTDRSSVEEKKARIGRARSSLITQADGLSRSMSLKWQSLVDGGEESSDFSVDDQSSLLELMQKLKKVDPEILILNYSSSENPNLASPRSSLQVDDVDSDSGIDSLRKKRQDFYVFAAYVPPGKHMILLRDVGTVVYKQHDTQPPEAQLTSIESQKFQTQPDRDIKPVSPNRKSAVPKSKNLMKVTKQKKSKIDSPASNGSANFKRLGKVQMEKSEYYHKELFVEPRENAILKTYSKPFSYEKMPIKSFMKPNMEQDSDDSADNKIAVSLQQRDSVFRDWIEENKKNRSIYFDKKVISNLSIKADQPKMINSSALNTPQDSPTGSNKPRFKGSFGKSLSRSLEIESSLPFSCLQGIEPEIKQVLWKDFQEIREIFHELAALDSFTYPLLSMQDFSRMCLEQGQGYLKAIVKPIVEVDLNATGKRRQSQAGPQIQAIGAKKNQNSPERTRKNNAGLKKKNTEQDETITEPVLEKPKELYTVDLTSTINQVLVAKSSRVTAPGEFQQSPNESLKVDLVGFFAHLLKIAIIWSNGKEDGINSVPQILKKMLKQDIPKLRRTISVGNLMMPQMYESVNLPYDIELFKKEELAADLVPILNHQFRHNILFSDSNVDKVLKIYQRALIGIFMLIQTKSSLSFEYDSCSIIQWSATLAGFRVPKKKPTKRALLKKLIETTKAQEASYTDAGTSLPAAMQPILPIIAIQQCFTKAKMLGSLEAESMNKKNQLERLPPMRRSIHQGRSIEPNAQSPNLITNHANKTGQRNDEKSQLSLLKPIDYRRLSFIEWQEFLCRVASCVHVIDSKMASKTKNPSLLRLVEESRKPFYVQVASFLSVALKQILINYGKCLSSVKIKEQEAELQELYEHVHEFDEAIESLDEASDVVV